MIISQMTTRPHIFGAKPEHKAKTLILSDEFITQQAVLSRVRVRFSLQTHGCAIELIDQGKQWHVDAMVKHACVHGASGRVFLTTSSQILIWSLKECKIISKIQFYRANRVWTWHDWIVVAASHARYLWLADLDGHIISEFETATLLPKGSLYGTIRLCARGLCIYNMSRHIGDDTNVHLMGINDAGTLSHASSFKITQDNGMRGATVFPIHHSAENRWFRQTTVCLEAQIDNEQCQFDMRDFDKMARSRGTDYGSLRLRVKECHQEERHQIIWLNHGVASSEWHMSNGRYRWTGTLMDPIMTISNQGIADTRIVVIIQEMLSNVTMLPSSLCKLIYGWV